MAGSRDGLAPPGGDDRFRSRRHRFATLGRERKPLVPERGQRLPCLICAARRRTRRRSPAGCRIRDLGRSRYRPDRNLRQDPLQGSVHLADGPGGISLTAGGVLLIELGAGH